MTVMTLSITVTDDGSLLVYWYVCMQNN